jgi:hypothetical protein
MALHGILCKTLFFLSVEKELELFRQLLFRQSIDGVGGF